MANLFRILFELKFRTPRIWKELFAWKSWYFEVIKTHNNSKSARIRKLPIRVFAQKDMHLENMVLHALITTNVYSELTTAIQMLFVLIMVADFIVIARRGFQKFRLRFWKSDRNLQQRGYEDADPSAGAAGGPETGTECVEDNECKDGTHSCPNHSYCVNTDASYNCDCYDGYYYGNNICNNINEVCNWVIAYIL